MSAPIFISYSHADAHFAAKITTDLEGTGYDVWLDRTDIKTGSHWDDEIVKGLDASQLMIVLLSASSSISQNVKDEIGYAIDHQKHIVPLLIEPCEIPFRLRRIQYVDFTTLPYKDGLKSVLEILQSTFPEADLRPRKKERQPMDPATLAAAATGLLLPFLQKLGGSAIEEAGAKLPDKPGKLWNAISSRFKGNPAASGAASDLVKNADDEDNQEVFALQLKKVLKEDPDFAAVLSDLFEEARGSISNVGDGAVATGGSIAVGTLKIGGNVSGNITVGNRNQIGNNNQQVENSEEG